VMGNSEIDNIHHRYRTTFEQLSMPYESNIGRRNILAGFSVQRIPDTTSCVIINGDGICSSLAAYRRANGSSPWAWSRGRRPSGAVLHSTRECTARPSSDFMDMLRRLINSRIIIIIIIINPTNRSNGV